MFANSSVERGMGLGSRSFDVVEAVDLLRRRSNYARPSREEEGRCARFGTGAAGGVD
jgi:hypothetical protein